MKPYGTAIVTFGMMFDGYRSAIARFKAGAQSQSPFDIYAPLFEALNWAVALDDRVAAHWAPDGEPLGWAWRERAPDGECVAGVRFARNRIHHQWSDAFALAEEAGGPEWVWRRSGDLPDGFTRGLAEYEVLSSTPVRLTLERLTCTYRWIGIRLEPERWTRD